MLARSIPDNLKRDDQWAGKEKPERAPAHFLARG